MGSLPKLGVPSWGSLNKDYSILGSILGYLHFGKIAHCCAEGGGVGSMPQRLERRLQGSPGLESALLET